LLYVLQKREINKEVNMTPHQSEKGLTRRGLLKGAAVGFAAGTLAEVRYAAAGSDGDAGWICNPSGIRIDGYFVDELLKQNMDEQKILKPPLAGQFPRLKVERVVGDDLFTTVNDLFYRRGWTDGLPIVPPMEERVEAMLRGTDLTPDTVVGLVEPMKGQATVIKIAVNAVMAGCRPEYMPVLIAAVQVIADQGFDMLGVSTTTNPDTPMIIVNGPIAKQLNINYGTNALGRGWQANATIGRALHLIVNNIGGSWPGITDMSCLGHPGEFAMCLAENEEKNPWTSLHVDLGYAKNANVVTVVPAESMQNLVGIGFNSEGYLGLIADYLAGLERTSRAVVLVFIAQDTAGMLASEGWTKDKVKKYILDHARMPFSKYKQKFIDTKKTGSVPDWILKTTDPNAMIPMPLVDQLTILVSGGTGEKSMVIPVWGSYRKLLSKEVKLPANWEKLLSERQ
jgi:hypothetical protein